MKNFDRGVYRAVLKVKAAYAFDIGGFLMRIYAYMATIGSISMLTLAGYSFFIAGTISSTIALATFFISPRVSKLIDEKGQHTVIPWAAVVTMLGLALMLITVSMQGPVVFCYVAALLMGFIPNAQALTRARWTYLVRSGHLSADAPTLKTVFSYEGIIDDIAFMIGPAASIALAAALFPVAGMLGGGVCFVAGAVILTLARSTEPPVGWANDASTTTRRRSIIVTSSVVRVLFVLMFFLGAFYGVFDTATVSFAEDVGDPSVASLILMVAACVSIVSGFVFGMIRLVIPQYAQLVATGVLIGCAYGSMALINSVGSLFAVSTIAALFYAPFLITANAACEQMVPGDRLTEAITWMNSGSVCGMAFGPTVGGIIIDELGTVASFDFGAVMAIMIPVTALVCLPILKRREK